MENRPATPLGGSRATLVRKLSEERLKGELSKYFGRPYPNSASIPNYEIWRCEETGLEFANPMTPGDATFYSWITEADFYYPGERWEYRRTIDEFLPAAKSLIDVGCGDGKFLLQAKGELPQLDVNGLDNLEGSIAQCKAQGLTAYAGTIDEVLAKHPELEHSFDAVTSFHCLEHVSSPLDFVRDLLRLRAPGGSLVVSTPLSPMTFEAVWFDIQNHPPHHMTRWTTGAYRRLADLLGLNVTFAFGPRLGFLRSLYQAIKMEMAGHRTRIGLPAVLRGLMARPLHYSAAIVSFSKAWLRADHPGSNGVMAVFGDKG